MGTEVNGDGGERSHAELREDDGEGDGKGEGEGGSSCTGEAGADGVGVALDVRRVERGAALGGEPAAPLTPSWRKDLWVVIIASCTS